MLYPKIQTLWMRHPDTGIIMPQCYSKDEFRHIKNWHITEKIDGMNVRIEYNQWKYENLNISVQPAITFKGRTDRAVMPKELMKYLDQVFGGGIFKLIFPDAKYVCLFGEGCGPKIQKGGDLYTDTQQFILFDIFVDGWWLKQDTVTEIAKDFMIERVPILGIWTKERAQDFVDPRKGIYIDEFKSVVYTPPSIIAKEPKEMEGIMCRSEPLMLFRNGNPIQFKLKVKDYKRLME